MKNIILLQIAIYLFISPLVIGLINDGREYPFDLSLIFLIVFVIGLAFAKLTHNFSSRIPSDNTPLLPQWMKRLIILMTLIYIYLIVTNNLVSRRQGSEEMATIFSQLSILTLLLIRAYEVLFYPIFLTVIYSLAVDRNRLTKLTLYMMVIGFFFTGVVDSKAKLMLPFIFLYILYKGTTNKQFKLSRFYLFFGFISLCTGVLLIGLDRYKGFDEFQVYLINDLVIRTDGLELISKVSQNVEIPFYGTLDLKIFVNFISSIPFLPESQILKAIGQTSSKNYLLKVILDSDSFDMNNSVLSDLYYFGGYLGILFGAAIYGYMVGKFDIAVRSNCLWTSRTNAAFLFSFMINAFRIEGDYFGMILATFRDFIIIFLFFLSIRLLTQKRFNVVQV